MSDKERIAQLEAKLESANSYIRWLDSQYKREYMRNRA